MKRIVMLLSNLYRPDPRVQREALGLVKAGFEVTIICWDRRAELAELEEADGIQIIRIHNVLSGYGSGWRQFWYFPRFWQKAVEIALELKPDAIHAHDLDTLYAGTQIKRRSDCRLVYDAHEHYPTMMSLYLPKPMVWTLTKWENWLINRADYIITASTVLRDDFESRGIKPVITLGNYPNFKRFAEVDDSDVMKVRASLGVTSNDLLLGYIAGLSLNREVIPLIRTAALLPCVKFHIWGDGAQREQVERESSLLSNVVYHGWLSYEDLPPHFHALDLVYYCLRMDYPGAVYNAPNTLGQAMASGRPIIASDVGDLGRIVKATDCGILLSVVSPDTIKVAIQSLSNPIERRRLSANGSRAARTKYNSEAMEHELVNLYRELT